MDIPKPSETMVKDTCLTACKMMKLVSKQLMVMSASYERIPLEKSSSPIYDTLLVVMESLRSIQESLIKTGSVMKLELSTEVTVDTFPKEIIVTEKEYKLLNAVFLEYMTVQSTSQEYSLFSSQSVYTPNNDKENVGPTSSDRRGLEESTP